MSLPLDGSSLFSGSAFPVFEGPILWWRLLKQRRNWKGLHVPVTSWCYNIFAKPFVYLFLFKTSPLKKKKVLLLSKFSTRSRLYTYWSLSCCLCLLFFNNFMDCFVFGSTVSWLLRRLSSRCGELWLPSTCVHGLLVAPSLVAEHSSKVQPPGSSTDFSSCGARLTCSSAFGIFLDQGLNLCFLY